MAKTTTQKTKAKKETEIPASYSKKNVDEISRAKDNPSKFGRK